MRRIGKGVREDQRLKNYGFDMIRQHLLLASS